MNKHVSEIAEMEVSEHINDEERRGDVGCQGDACDIKDEFYKITLSETT